MGSQTGERVRVEGTRGLVLKPGRHHDLGAGSIGRDEVPARHVGGLRGGPRPVPGSESLEPAGQPTQRNPDDVLLIRHAPLSHPLAT